MRERLHSIRRRRAGLARAAAMLLATFLVLGLDCDPKDEDFFLGDDGGGPTDQIAPVISFLTPPGTVLNDDKVCINVTDQGGSGLGPVTATSGTTSLPVTPGTGPGAFNIGIGAAAQGLHTIGVTARDNAGNQSTGSINIDKDTQAPTVGNFDVPGPQTSGALTLSLTVRYRLTDPHPGATTRFSIFTAGADNVVGNADDVAVPQGTTGATANPATQTVTGTGTGMTRDFTATFNVNNGNTNPGTTVTRLYYGRIEASDTADNCSGQDNPNTATVNTPPIEVRWVGLGQTGFTVGFNQPPDFWRHLGAITDLCANVTTTPAQPGGQLTTTATGPGVLTPTRTAVLDAQGTALVRHTINQFGLYTINAAVTSGGTTSTGQTTVNVNAAQGSCPAASSMRFKRDVVALLPDGATLLGLRPVSFRYLAPYGDPEVPQVGLIAEEVARRFPQAVALDERGRPAAIDYRSLSALVMQEVGARVSAAVEHAIARLAETR